MDLVQEENRAGVVRAPSVLGALDHRADLGAAGLDGARLLERGAGLGGGDAGERRLPAPRRAVEDHRVQLRRSRSRCAAPSPAPSRCSWPDELVQRRAGACAPRAARPRGGTARAAAARSRPVSNSRSIRSPSGTTVSCSMEYVALAAWCFVVALGGGLVGLVLGNIRLPVVLLLASSPGRRRGREHRHQRGRGGHRVDRAHPRAGASTGGCSRWMAPPSIVGRARRAATLGRAAGRRAAARDRRGAPLQRVRAAAPGRRPSREAATPMRPSSTSRRPCSPALVIGLLGGIVGLILGSLRMPALLRFVGEAPARAVGTNVTVGFWSASPE